MVALANSSCRSAGFLERNLRELVTSESPDGYIVDGLRTTIVAGDDVLWICGESVLVEIEPFDLSLGRATKPE